MAYSFQLKGKLYSIVQNLNPILRDGDDVPLFLDACDRPEYKTLIGV